mmetsp:Transcript_18596/g.28111  ORF Transcript_18596/g.28111 Transcript_18596/m.28111 type:complete len:586 (-) Transcript_18596:2768-4525(-)|eukprot:CAMPEP_0178931976 /NCGR_PEP_ID=MMETSP0786-20121207/22280_1 /TAXON_ID=186022 /ORGANISM="Thalassionema frauenfeldii, Strain CCMP 1798" /LENGTH=585 /DNA_ID=CAMNT_0020609055 /DNA_START=135 /DNA_END=1892 /DNA_ORIENTATION=-
MTVLTRIVLIATTLSAIRGHPHSPAQNGLCMVAILTSDSDDIDAEDNGLSKREYLNFLHKLSQDTYECETYQELPAALQDIFDSYSSQSQLNNSTIKQGPSKILITKILPGELGNQTQDQFLFDLCFDVHEVMEQGGNNCNVSPIANLRQAISTSIRDLRSVSSLQCFSALSAADENESKQMEAEEYVIFVNRLSNDGFKNFTFLELPEVIQRVFHNWSTNSAIDVSDSTPGSNPSQGQLNFLKQVCDDTGTAIGLALELSAPPSSFEATIAPTVSSTLSILPTQVPTQSPTNASQIPTPLTTSPTIPLSITSLFPTSVPSSTPSVASSEVLLNIPVAFIVSNKNSSSISNSDRKVIFSALNQMCSDIVEMKDSGPIYVNNSASIDVQKIECPQSASSGSFCHAVYFTFQVSVVKTSDSEDIRQEFSDAAQMAIAVGSLSIENLNVDIEFGFVPSRSRSFNGNNEEMNITLILGASVAVMAFITLLFVIWYLIRKKKIENMLLDDKNLMKDKSSSRQSPSDYFKGEHCKTVNQDRDERPLGLISLDLISEQSDSNDEESIDQHDLSDTVVVKKDPESLQMSSHQG